VCTENGKAICVQGGFYQGEWLEGFNNSLTPDCVPGREPRWREIEDHPGRYFTKTFPMSELNWVLGSARDLAPGLDGVVYSMLDNLPVQAKRILLQPHLGG